MSPSQASSDFPRLTGAGNFDVWKTRVRAALDGKNQLGFIDKRDYDGTSDDDDIDIYAGDDEDMSAASDAEDDGSSPSLEERTNGMQLDDAPLQGPDDESKIEEPPVILPFAEARGVSAAAKRGRVIKPQKHRARGLMPSEVRRADARVKSFLMKTLDDKHILMVKSHDKSYDIYQTICKKYEGTTASGDPYVIMAFLFNARYEEGKDLTEFLIRYERAIESLNLALGIVLGASVSSVFLYNAMPKAWENEMRIWRSTRNIIPYEELKANLEAYVTNKLTQERFALARVPAAVRDGFHFTFKPSHCVINTSQHLSIKARMKDENGLYQFKAIPGTPANHALVGAVDTAKI
ncbi:hypothetical protein ATCC90586_001835 [Pythium insidiosum]|nr:hypothetical protein ATCC90586_001835 [Pythium insidiosum]